MDRHIFYCQSFNTGNQPIHKILISDKFIKIVLI